MKEIKTTAASPKGYDIINTTTILRPIMTTGFESNG
jgi:hypothetical protein